MDCSPLSGSCAGGWGLLKVQEVQEGARGASFAVAFFCVLATVATAAAEQRYALVLSGASGGPKCAEQMAEWRNGIRTALVDRYGFTADNVRLFVDETVKTGEQGTAQNVRSALGTLRKQLTADDLLLIVFLGHGTFDGTVAKFNLIGPDLSAAEWGTLFNGLPGRLVVVNTTEASFHFSNGCPQPIAS